MHERLHDPLILIALTKAACLSGLASLVFPAGTASLQARRAAEEDFQLLSDAALGLMKQ